MRKVQRYLETLSFALRQGEEWHRYRTAVSKHMLKLPAIGQFSKPVDAVCEDFVERLSRIKDNKGEVNALQTEIFKWAMECMYHTHTHARTYTLA